MNKRFKFITSLIITILLTIAGVSAFQIISKANGLVNYKFDFGAGGEASGYTALSASDAYSSSTGYGFSTPENMKNVSASGSDALSDAVQFVESGINSNNTFNVDLPDGVYRITVTLGNTTRTSIAAEGCLQLINLTGNNATDSFEIPVTDGQLNIMATAGKAGYAYTLSTLEIEQISTDTSTKQTIWLCGDSTVCNYYPKDSSSTVGWGQVLDEYVDTNTFNIRNMAAGGQYAKGFIDGGQFDAIEKYGKSGDYYIISIGINDTNYSNEAEYKEAVTDMTIRAKAKGMTVILVKQQGRSTDVTNNPNLTGRWFGGILDEVGSEQDVQVLDLFNLAFNHFKSIGQEATNALYVDGLHFNRDGAKVLAKIVSENVKFEALSSNSDNSVSNDNSSNSDNNTSNNNISNDNSSNDNSNSNNSSEEDLNTDNNNTGRIPTLFIIGDSTACNYKASDAPMAGWGQMIANHLGSNVNVSNHAIGGRSSKMFINEGRFDTVCEQMQAGDYLLVQFGINDANYNNADRYTPVSDGTFQECMRTFANKTLEKGATPVFLTPVLGLGSYSNGQFVNSYTEYGDAAKSVAQELGINCIDVNTLMVEHYNSVGYDTAYTYHMISTSQTSTDKTHFTETGADATAKIIADALASIGITFNETPSDNNQDSDVQTPDINETPDTEETPDQDIPEPEINESVPTETPNEDEVNEELDSDIDDTPQTGDINSIIIVIVIFIIAGISLLSYKNRSNM